MLRARAVSGQRLLVRPSATKEAENMGLATSWRSDGADHECVAAQSERASEAHGASDLHLLLEGPRSIDSTEDRCTAAGRHGDRFTVDDHIVGGEVLCAELCGVMPDATA